MEKTEGRIRLRGGYMEEISSLLREVLNIDFVRAVISNPVKKEGIIKVKVRPVETKGNLHFQI